MKTEPNDPIQPVILRQIGENEFRIAGMHDQMHDKQWLSSTSGLSKREYFAGLALQGILAGFHTNADVMATVSRFCQNKKHSPDQYIAVMSLEYADALITELNK